MARVTNKKKIFNKPTRRRQKDILFRDYMNRKTDHERKNKNS